MKSRFFQCCLLSMSCGLVCTAYGQQPGACAELEKLKIPGVKMEIAKAATLPAGPASSPGGYAGLFPQYCRVEGVINRRTGVDGKEYGIGFAIALPENWNRKFMMLGGGGANGVITPLTGGYASGKTPALARGFAVASTDTGHKAGPGGFDFSFMKDQQAFLDFAYQANAEVAEVAKQIIATYYGKSASYSYFVGCSTGGREGMILSERYPTEFDGVISGAPARRTGFSNIAAGPWAAVAYNQAAPKDLSGKPLTTEALSDSDRKLVMSALLDRCDAKDGVIDGMIFDPLGCDFDPSVLTCKGAKTDACLSAQQVRAIEQVFAGPKDSRGFQVYPGYLYDTGVAAKSPIPGLLTLGSGPFGPPSTAMELDVDQMARNASSPLVDALSTNLGSFSGHGGKLIFYHGDSDPWFSPLDTLEYYRAMARDNGGLEKVAGWSQIYLVPGMGHCGGGEAALDQFDLLSAVADWVEKGKSPQAVIATGKAFPGRSRPLCAYPKHTHYKGSGDSELAENFDCR